MTEEYTINEIKNRMNEPVYVKIERLAKERKIEEAQKLYFENETKRLGGLVRL